METTRELSPERVGELVADAATPVVHRALWAVLWDGELRLADALSADVRDVSFESGTITVDLPLRGRGPVALPMSDRTAALLREAIADRTEGPLLVSDSGNPLSREAAIRRAQTTGVGIHAFRYSGRLHREAAGTGHYQDCYAPHELCRCEAIDREEEDYRAEPDDMAAREMGCF